MKLINREDIQSKIFIFCLAETNNTWCGYKINGLILNIFIQKITQQKCCHPRCTPLPDPYTAPCESSTVGSNAARRLLIAYS